jgi:hypothetical protein
VNENPYQAPQAKNDCPPKGADYDPLAITGKLTRIWWIVAAIATSLAVAGLVFR